MTLLEVTDLSARHGLLQAVRGVTFSVEQGETIALVGANGAGKSTLLRTLVGAHAAAGGTIQLDGKDITQVPAYRRVGLGMALVPEGRKLFADMTVEENLLVAGRRAGKGEWNVEAVMAAFPMLQPLRHKRASQLSGGQQQATSIGRALMTNPRLLFVDEVSLGLAPIAVDSVYESLLGLIRNGATVVLVEQDLRRAMAVADRVICFLEGRIVLEAPTGSVTREQITEAYFGLRPPAPEANETDQIATEAT